MSKHIKLQQNIYNTYLALKSHKKQQDFLEKCFVFAWEGKEIETKDDVVSIAFLAVKPSLKITETSENWGGSRKGSGKKHNQDDNQLDNQDETKSESSSNQVPYKNKDISNKYISNKNKDINNNSQDDLLKNEPPNIGANITTTPLKEEESKDSNNTIQEKNKYSFNGVVIKLNQKDFDKWKKEYSNINLEMELKLLDLWYQEDRNKDKQKNWFFATQRILLKKNQEKEYKYWL